MDKSLDEIIATRPRGIRRGARRGSGRAQILGTTVVSPIQKARAASAATTKAAATPNPQPADKIIVSNLPADVNEEQVKELFHTTVGPLREVNLHCDAAGRSRGVAFVHFQKKGDGTKAYQQYNNRLIDGKRAMKIEIVLDPAKVPAQSLVSRVAPSPATTNGTQTQTIRPRVRRVRRGGPRKNERPAKSAADLDAEMEDYTASNAPAATA